MLLWRLGGTGAGQLVTGRNTLNFSYDSTQWGDPPTSLEACIQIIRFLDVIIEIT